LIGYSSDNPGVDQQIAFALLAAPEEEREACTVLGYDESGNVVTFREGTNGLICLADDPANNGFSAACYKKELEPYMRRGRELRKQGADFQTVFDTREQEVMDGTLPMPDRSILTVLTGELNAETGKLENTYMRYVIYIPFATPESTGIPLKPASPGGPWIMNPGTHRAHIMINPPRPE
jgi:hypothetical protein